MMRISTATRMTSRILALTLVIMASASGGSWRCLDGTPCHADCGMEAGHALVTEVTNACGMCPGSSVLIPASSSSARLSAPNGCILDADERPLVLVQEWNPIPLDGLATLPTAPEVIEFAQVQIPNVTYVDSYQKHLRRPDSGRSPPVVS